MTTKIPLLFAIIALLPFGAWAGTITYTQVNSPATAPYINGNEIRAVMTTAAPPYATVTIENDDDEHIASTAYVKGAYNDTIAGINALDRRKQNSFEVWDEEEDDFFSVSTVVRESVYDVDERDQLVTGMAVKNAMEGVYEDFEGNFNDFANALSSKRVTIYTTWEDDSDNATTKVELSVAD